MTEEERKEVIRRIRENDEANTRTLDNLTQIHGDLVFNEQMRIHHLLIKNGCDIAAALMSIGMYEYTTRVFNDLLDEHDEESSSDE